MQAIKMVWGGGRPEAQRQRGGRAGGEGVGGEVALGGLCHLGRDPGHWGREGAGRPENGKRRGHQ